MKLLESVLFNWNASDLEPEMRRLQLELFNQKIARQQLC